MKPPAASLVAKARLWRPLWPNAARSLKTPESLALDSSFIVRHMRTSDPASAAAPKAVTELYLPLTALGEMRFGLQRAGNSRRAIERWERFSHDVVILLPAGAYKAVHVI